MALVEKYQGIAAIQKVDTSVSGTGYDIKEGMLVYLSGANGVRRVTTGASQNAVYGVAADNYSQSSASMPGINTSGIVGGGKSASWQGRVSDAFDETRASGKMSVYISGGEYATDQFVDSNVAAGNVGQIMVAGTGGTLTNAGAYVSVATAIAASKQPIAMLTLAKGAYPSGVPGVDVTPNNDIALSGDNSNTYIEFKLLI
jgi:hypothetical protein